MLGMEFHIIIYIVSAIVIFLIIAIYFANQYINGGSCPPGYFLSKGDRGDFVCVGCPSGMTPVVGGCIREFIDAVDSGAGVNGKCPPGYKKLRDNSAMCSTECPPGTIEYNGALCGKHYIAKK